MLITVTGPSASGKSNFVEMATAAHPDLFRRVITHTTRQPRPGEVNGRDYHFCSPAEFVALRASGEILEETAVCGNYYGTTRGALLAAMAKGVALLVVDPNGLAPTRAVAAAAHAPALSVFLSTPLAVCRTRLAARADAAIRIANAELEMAWASAFVYEVVRPLQHADDQVDLLQELLRFAATKAACAA